MVLTFLMDAPGTITSTTVTTFPQFALEISIEGQNTYVFGLDGMNDAKYSNYSAILTYGPYINSILLNLVHYFLPVYYGDVKLYKPKVGATREPFETRCTITLQSNLLLRVPFQASTSGNDEGN